MKKPDNGWLGEIPVHWEINKLKYNLRRITKTTARCQNRVSLENVESWTGRLVPTEGEFQGDGIAFEKGDILFGKLRPYLAKVHLAENPGEAVGDFYVLRPVPKIDGRFARYQMLSPTFIDLVDSSTYGARMPRASWRFVGQTPMATPTVTEQQAIADFLDRETVRIDALIEKKQRQVALLKEKRSAQISQVVTRGLNPDVEMRDSDIEWLGEIPAHWETQKLKRVGYFKGGAGFPHEQQGVSGEELNFYKVNALSQANRAGVLPPGNDTISRETAKQLRAHIFPADSIVFAKVGAALLLGRIRSLGENACIDNNMMGLVVSPAMYSVTFTKYAMSLIHFRLLANPGTVPTISESQIGNLYLAFPPLAEQQAIADFLDRETAHIDALVGKIEQSVELLRERRGALITAAVTGEIDVREETRDL